jgi:hypothetical protein
MGNMAKPQLAERGETQKARKERAPRRRSQSHAGKQRATELRHHKKNPTLAPLIGFKTAEVTKDQDRDV